MKRTIPTNNDYRFDIDMSKAKIQIDDNVFHPSELPCVEMFNSILDAKIEIKNQEKFLKTGNLFIEYQIQINGNTKPSGIQTTQANWWMMKAGFSVLFFPTKFLRYCFQYREILELDIKDNSYEKNYIGYGLILPVNRLQDLLKKYDKYFKENRLKKVRREIQLKKDINNFSNNFNF